MESWPIHAFDIAILHSKQLCSIKSLVQVQLHELEDPGHLIHQQSGEVMDVPGLSGEAQRAGPVQEL